MEPVNVQEKCRVQVLSAPPCAVHVAPLAPRVELDLAGPDPTKERLELPRGRAR